MVSTGGLVKALIEARLATLKQTRAMLAQRATAGDLNIALRYTVDGKPFTLPEGTAGVLTAVEQEIASTKAQIAAGQAEVAKYSGGVVLAMSLATVATLQQSLAMLEQKRLSLKYGLPQFIGFAESNKSASGLPVAASAPSPSATGTAVAADWEIVSVESRVTESNDQWWKYAWKLTLRNKGAATHAFSAKIEFQDKDGFVVDDSESDVIVVHGNSEETATGYTLVRMPGAGNVAKTLAKVGVVR